MKKGLRVLSSLVAAVLCMQVAFAAPSIRKNGAVTSATMNGEAATVVFQDLTTTGDTTVDQQIADLNSGKDLATVLDSAKVENAGDVKGLALLTAFQDLVVKDQDGNVVKDAKNVTATWEVQNLSKDLGTVKVLHYSTVRNVWELLDCTPNYDEKTVTCTFADLSPVAVVYVPLDANKTTTADGSTNTGVEATHYALYAGMAVVALAGVAYFARKKQSN